MFGPRHGNTRFNPTPTGDLHMGHVYLCLVNQYEAHQRGAQFLVRIDDTQQYWSRWMLSWEKMRHYAERTLEDLAWMGLAPDGVVYQSEIIAMIHQKIRMLYGVEIPEERIGADYSPVVKGMRAPMCYTPGITCEKVMLDFYQGVDLLIRGMDLLDEFALYAYWCDRFRIHTVYHVYLPRLVLADGEDPAYYGNVSKTHGVLTVRQQRDEGRTAEELLKILRWSCLVDPSGPWSVENVTEQPVWRGYPVKRRSS